MKSWKELLATAASLRFEPHDIAAEIDARGHYEVELDAEFPLLIKLFHYSSRRHTRGATWHERLELFMPLDGPARFRMGGQEIGLSRGDLLVVDNLKLHHVLDFPGFDTRVIVISFLPEFVYSLGSPSHDYAFLLPFFAKLEKRPHILHPADPLAPQVYAGLVKLLECYFAPPQFFEAGCKAFLLEILFHLARHFQTSQILKSELVRQQERAAQLKKLFEHISRNHAEKMTLAQAARMAGMSPPKFTKVFKKVAGMTFVAYVNHVRLANAARLLKDTTKSVVQIANEVGFTDQSYFDKRFRRSFGQTPLDLRRQAIATAGNPAPVQGENRPKN